jgi:hypothetical protein
MIEEIKKRERTALEIELNVIQYLASFSMDGERFIGTVEKKWQWYKELNPDKKFRIWLIDSGFKIYNEN